MSLLDRSDQQFQNRLLMSRVGGFVRKSMNLVGTLLAQMGNFPLHSKCIFLTDLHVL